MYNTYSLVFFINRMAQYGEGAGMIIQTMDDKMTDKRIR